MWPQLNVLALCVALLGVGCHRDADQNDGDEFAPAQTNAPASPSGQASVAAAQTQGQQQLTAQGRAADPFAGDPSVRVLQGQDGKKIIQSAPVAAPPSYFSPSGADVQQALADVLVATVSKMPNSPERTKFYQSQVNLLQTLRVNSCTQAPVGQPSVCAGSMGGKGFQIKILLTQGGWVIVK